MTIDQRRPHAEAGDPVTLPAFTPVPRHYRRHDGWTPARQQGFIEALADTGSVKAAAHAVNMTPEGAYHLRRHPEAQEFRAAWEAALALGVQRLEDTALERALHGIEVPVYSYGKLIGARRVYNDRLLMFMLRSRAPKRFGEPGRMDLADRAQLANLKRQWRAEWERERALAYPAERAGTLEAINTRIERMREDWIAKMSPRTRRLHEAFERADSLDRERSERERSKPLKLPPGWGVGKDPEGED